MKVIKNFVVILILLLIIFTTINNVGAESVNGDISQIDFGKLSEKDDLIFNNFTYYLEAYAKSIIGVDNPQPENTLCV